MKHGKIPMGLSGGDVPANPLDCWNTSAGWCPKMCPGFKINVKKTMGFHQISPQKKTLQIHGRGFSATMFRPGFGGKMWMLFHENPWKSNREKGKHGKTEGNPVIGVFWGKNCRKTFYITGNSITPVTPFRFSQQKQSIDEITGASASCD